MKLQALPGTLAVCRVKELSAADLTREFCFLGKTDEEISLVCPSQAVPKDALSCQDGWRGFRVQGVLDFSLVGILAELSAVLAGAGIGIFAVSTFNTDYILVRENDFDRAAEALAAAGHIMEPAE